MADPVIAVLAGTNGAGKSSVGGALVEQHGGSYFNPDRVAGEIHAERPRLPIKECNSLAWQEGLRQLRKAIEQRKDFTFESTLGGSTMTDELLRAAASGCEVCIWYVGLASAELHIERVAARVAQGGHDIPEADIRRRFDRSRENLVRLIPKVTELKLFDNSAAANPRPEPTLLLHLRGGARVAPDAQALARTPDWAKPVVEAALQWLERKSRRRYRKPRRKGTPGA